MTNRSARARRGGFTLIELLAAMAILSLLIGLALTMVSKARATGNKTACSLQLRDIAVVMQDYVDHRKDGKWPKERGIRFLLTVVKDDVIRGDDLKKFVCPATDDITARSESEAVGSGIKDWDDLDPECISYAGRDNTGANALKKDRLSEEILASDDNWSGGAGRANHAGITNVVFADGHVATIETSKYKGELSDPEQDWLPVGPESPDENLRKLAVD